MAWLKGRQPQEETAKAECLRRWPNLKLTCVAVYYHGKREGYVMLKDGKSFALLGDKTAERTWQNCISHLEDAEAGGGE